MGVTKCVVVDFVTISRLISTGDKLHWANLQLFCTLVHPPSGVSFIYDEIAKSRHTGSGFLRICVSTGLLQPQQNVVSQKHHIYRQYLGINTELTHLSVIWQSGWLSNLNQTNTGVLCLVVIMKPQKLLFIDMCLVTVILYSHCYLAQCIHHTANVLFPAAVITTDVK